MPFSRLAASTGGACDRPRASGRTRNRQSDKPLQTGFLTLHRLSSPGPDFPGMRAARCGAHVKSCGIVVKRCPVCKSINVRRSSAGAAEARSHGFQSPYRCETCDTRFWVISRKARLAAAAAAVCVLVIVLAVVSSIPLPRHSSQLIQAGPLPADAGTTELVSDQDSRWDIGLREFEKSSSASQVVGSLEVR